LKKKNPVTSSGIEPGTLSLVAQFFIYDMHAPMNWKESVMRYFEVNSRISLEGPTEPTRLLNADTYAEVCNQTEDLQNANQNCHGLDYLVRLNLRI
jgi:hypothetical protein